MAGNSFKSLYPLTSGFMLTSIIGFLVSAFFVMKISNTWGFTLCLFFIVMFVSSIVSMSNIEAEERYDYEHLAIHKTHTRKK